jgi:HSP20 family protein
MNYSHLFNEFLAPNYGAQPDFEAREEGDHYLLSVDLPGATRDAIKLEVHDRQVRISAERNGQTKQRAFTFGEKLDAAKVEADYRDGVLRVYLPKHEAARPRQIAVGGAEPPKAGFFAKLLGKTQETQAA